MLQIENLKAMVYGKETTPYQRALALREFLDLIDMIDLLQVNAKTSYLNLPQSLIDKIDSWDDGGCSTGLNDD